MLQLAGAHEQTASWLNVIVLEATMSALVSYCMSFCANSTWSTGGHAMLFNH